MKKSVKPEPKDLAVYPVGGGSVFSVREAKAQLSALVGRAARGEEVTITWHGQSRARLIPIPSEGAPLRVDRAWLGSQTVCRQGARAEDLVRSDRDAKG